MKIRVEQLNPIVGDLEGNTSKILEALENAQKEQVSLLILPEMVLTGYPPMDLLERHSFIGEVGEAVRTIIKKTDQHTTLIFGSPTPNNKSRGRFIYNSAIVAHHGVKLGEIHKTLLPTYDVFDEGRYFEPNQHFEPVEINGIKFGITICEDIWYNDNEKQYVIYDKRPAEILKKEGADVIINISASPFTQNKSVYRRKMLKANVQQNGLPVLYANQCGANTELIFDGDSMALDSRGKTIGKAKLFEPDYFDVVYNKTAHQLESTTRVSDEVPDINARLFKALTTGLSEYISKTAFTQKVILGLSGGIDSALTAVIASEALGADNVTGITMPSRFSSTGSVTDSERLAENLGIQLKKIPIKNIYDTYLQVLKPHFEGTEFGTAEENLQSRARGMILMALSNKFGHMLLATGNKSELAVGYNTLYGDLAGGLAVIADLYKTEVYNLCNWLNNTYYKKEIIPQNIIDKPPSAELKPEQQDSDSLPDYEILDAILKKYLEQQLGIEEIVGKGFKREMVERVAWLIHTSEFKRFQAPPVLKLSQKAFGTGRRIPIVKKR